jgi:hypothetical protein
MDHAEYIAFVEKKSEMLNAIHEVFCRTDGKFVDRAQAAIRCAGWEWRDGFNWTPPKKTKGVPNPVVVREYRRSLPTVEDLPAKERRLAAENAIENIASDFGLTPTTVLRKLHDARAGMRKQEPDKGDFYLPSKR